MNSELAILMPTFDRYRWLADFTESYLDRWWPGHPPVWRCGCSNPSGPRELPLRNDSRDWMGIALSAARDLEAKGVRSCYVVLDDMPPIGSCHMEHLNETVPRWLNELDAACIGLHGSGQGCLSAGNNFDATRMDLQHVPSTFNCRYSLHPTLWQLRAFIELLEELTRTDDLKKRSAWAFERRADETLQTPAGKWSERAYRVCGVRMVSPDYHPHRAAWLWTLRKITGGTHVVSRAIGWKQLKEVANYQLYLLYRNYVGPYPLVHSGLMAAGRPNRHFVRFMGRFGDRSMLDSFLRAAEGAGVGGR